MGMVLLYPMLLAKIFKYILMLVIQPAPVKLDGFLPEDQVIVLLPKESWLTVTVLAIS